MITALASGVLLGLSAGLSPGPLLALVMSQALRHGAREGCRVALVPLVTDGPIILIVWLFAARVAEHGRLLGLISIAGGAFVLYLAWDSLRPVNLALEGAAEPPRSWLKGIVTNLLSPHPWLFWLTVGTTMLAKALEQSVVTAIAFLFGFYVLLVGSKVLVALLAARSRHLLAGRAYRMIMRILAVLLGTFALLLFREGWRHLAG